MKNSKRIKYIIILLITLSISKTDNAQIDSIVRSLTDSVISKLLVDDIPRTTFKEKFMYPHRWYVKQLLTPKITDFDTTYIISNKRKLTITAPITKKYYGFNIDDLDKNRKIKFSPNTYFHLGFNFSNIILTFGFSTGIKFGSKPDRGETKSIDFQLTIIGRRVITDVNYQNYKGFYFRNPTDFSSSVATITRPDVKTISYGVNTLFVTNYKKYSLRGAFSFTDVQRKSAGSFMAGLYHSNVVFSSNDSTFINYPIRNYFSNPLTHINKISVITIGLSAGYGYTFVYKRIIVSSAFNAGIGGEKINYATIDDQGHTLGMDISVKVNAKASLRYDNLKFFSGVMATYDNNFTFNSTLFNTENYIAKLMFFVGYRFNIKQNGRKILKALRLVDYQKHQ